MTTQGERVRMVDWVDALTEEQLRQALKDTVELLASTEYIRFGELAPYWESCGEPIVHGQQTHKDD